jgi:hypothetical protein
MPFFKMGIGFQNLLIIILRATHCTNKFYDFSQCSLVSMEYNCEGPMEKHCTVVFIINHLLTYVMPLNSNDCNATH